MHILEGCKRSTLAWAGVVGTALLVILATALPAGAAGAWTQPVVLGAPQDSWLGTVATSPAGGAVAAWLQTDTVPYRVHAALRAAGSRSWEGSVAISTQATVNPYPIEARMDKAGDAFVAWYDNGFVYAAIRPVGSPTWLPTVKVVAGSLAGFAVTPAGDATILSGTYTTVYVVDRPAGGSWQPPVTIADPPLCTASDLALDDDGGAVALWETYEPAPEPQDRTNYVLHASRRATFASPWGAEAVLSTPLPHNYGHAARVGLDANGDAVVVARQLSGDPVAVLQAVMQASGGGWSAPVTVSEPGATVGYPDLTVDADGDATVTWASLGVTNVATAKAPANAWSPQITISPPGTITGYPAIAGNRSGANVVTWAVFDPPTGRYSLLQATVRSAPTESWRVVQTIAKAMELSNGVVAVDRAGRAVAIWNETPRNWIGQITRTSTYLP
jgi:hypothetical protein